MVAEDLERGITSGAAVVEVKAGRVRGSGDDSMRRYLGEIGAHPLLTAADEVALGRAIAVGRAAAARLAESIDRR